MADHDQRFKTLLKEFFAEFIRLFFPHGRIDSISLPSNGWTRKRFPIRPRAGRKSWTS